jgi:hypothetical protein
MNLARTYTITPFPKGFDRTQDLRALAERYPAQFETAKAIAEFRMSGAEAFGYVEDKKASFKRAEDFPDKKSYWEWHRWLEFFERFGGVFFKGQTLEEYIADEIYNEMRENDPEFQAWWNERENYRNEIAARQPVDETADSMNKAFLNKKNGPWRKPTAEETRRKAAIR